MYIGDPNIVFVIYAFSKLLQNPKSQSLIIPLWKNILSGFKSLCMILYLFNILKASNNCFKITNEFFSYILFYFLNNPYNVPPLQY